MARSMDVVTAMPHRTGTCTPVFVLSPSSRDRPRPESGDLGTDVDQGALGPLRTRSPTRKLARDPMSPNTSPQPGTHDATAPALALSLLGDRTQASCPAAAFEVKG